MALASLAPVYTVAISGELASPALQRGEANAQEQSQLTVSGTIGNTLVENLLGFPAVVRGRQASPYSPQKA